MSKPRFFGAKAEQRLENTLLETRNDVQRLADLLNTMAIQQAQKNPVISVPNEKLAALQAGRKILVDASEQINNVLKQQPVNQVTPSEPKAEADVKEKTTVATSTNTSFHR